MLEVRVLVPLDRPDGEAEHRHGDQQDADGPGHPPDGSWGDDITRLCTSRACHHTPGSWQTFARPCRSTAGRYPFRIRRRCFSRRPGHTKLDLVQLLPRGGRGRAARRRRPARTCWCAIRTASTASSSTRSARRRAGPTGSTWWSSSFPRAAAPRRWCRATPRRSPGWRTSAASSCIRTRCARRTSSIPTSCASTSIRCRA